MFFLQLPFSEQKKKDFSSLFYILFLIVLNKLRELKIKHSPSKYWRNERRPRVEALDIF